MNDDTISRQWLMECVEEGWIKFDTQEDENRFVHLIRDIAPSAQQWIPWNSGRYPDESRWYIVTAYDGNTSRVTFAKYQTRLKRWELTGARAYWRVLAWCELPEPWKGDTP